MTEEDIFHNIRVHAGIIKRRLEKSNAEGQRLTLSELLADITPDEFEAWAKEQLERS